MKGIVICKLPKAGLGNQLFPLMHAYLFAKLNGLEVMVTGYHQLKLGPYLRNEKVKRRYSGYFVFQKGIVKEVFDKCRIKILQKKFEVVSEPPIAVLSESDSQRKLFLFEKLPTYHDYFKHLRAHRDEVRELLYELLNPEIVDILERQKPPSIAVHIRMGDFRKLNYGESFRGGHVRTPMEYFIIMINGIRDINSKALHVTIFTDGRQHELGELMKLNNTAIAKGNPDIVDLLLLSRSKLIITSTGSTFSYWAAFLSDASVILHPDHLYAPFRPGHINEIFYEGPFDANNINPILKRNIQLIN